MVENIVKHIARTRDRLTPLSCKFYFAVGRKRHELLPERNMVAFQNRRQALAAVGERSGRQSIEATCVTIARVVECVRRIRGDHLPAPDASHRVKTDTRDTRPQARRIYRLGDVLILGKSGTPSLTLMVESLDHQA